MDFNFSTFKETHSWSYDPPTGYLLLTLLTFLAKVALPPIVTHEPASFQYWLKLREPVRNWYKKNSQPTLICRLVFPPTTVTEMVYPYAQNGFRAEYL